jgi:[acyl-carrier-protein] S-malonyltransferase
VITGLREAVDRASVWLKEAGARRILPLQVSGPFHSVMLEEAGQKLAKVLEDVSLSELKIPYVTNVNAQYVNDSKETKDLLAKQICSSVKWQQSVEKMIEDGVDTFIEIGPGKTLTGFLKKIAPQVTSYNIQTVEDFKKVRVDVR